MSLAIRSIGTPLDRVDGVPKVTGTAIYAYEHAVEQAVYVFPVQSTIAKGRIVAIDASDARAVPGVLAVLSHQNAPHLAPVADGDLPLFPSDAVAYYGQFVAAVVAETSEVASYAASLVVVRYNEQPHHVELHVDQGGLYAPAQLNANFATDTNEGDVDNALAAATVSLDHI